MNQLSSLEQSLQAFDINKYSDAKQLSPFGWSNALIERKLDLDSLTLGRNIFDNKPGWEDRILQKYMESPCNFAELNNRESQYANMHHVYDTTVFEIFERNRLLKETTDLKEPYNLYTENWINASEEHDFDFSPPKTLEKSSDYLLNNANAANPYEALISVNMCASDEVIISSFKSWLNQKRKFLQERGWDDVELKPFRDGRFKRWARLQLLGYIDLEIIAKRFKTKIPNHRIGTILFPEEYDTDTAERVRKLIRPEAKFAMRESTLMTLETFALSNQV